MFKNLPGLLSLSIERNSSVLIENSDYRDCAVSRRLGAVNAFVSYNVWRKSNTMLDKITELGNQVIASGKGDSWVYAHGINAAVSINNATPEISVNFKANYFGSFAFVWNNAIFCKVRNHFYGINSHSDLWPRDVFPNKNSRGCVNHFQSRGQKFLEFLHMLRVFIGQHYRNSFAPNGSVGHHKSNPIGTFWSDECKCVIIKWKSFLSACFYTAPFCHVADCGVPYAELVNQNLCIFSSNIPAQQFVSLLRGKFKTVSRPNLSVGV